MLFAIKNYGKIYVDKMTKSSATHEIDFTYVEHLESSNRVNNEPVYQPLSSDSDDKVIADYNEENQ